MVSPTLCDLKKYVHILSVVTHKLSFAKFLCSYCIVIKFPQSHKTYSRKIFVFWVLWGEMPEILLKELAYDYSKY